MSSYDDFENERRRNRNPEVEAKKLRARIKAGEDHLKPELAEVIMQSAQRAAAAQQFDKSLKFIDEAVKIIERLIDEGQIEFQASLGRCFLFRAAILRIHQGPEAGLKAFNETIYYFAERADSDNPFSQNELAIALMNKADLLIDPFGAHSAAIAAQEQAARIWQRLVDRGSSEFRQQLISTLLACGDSKILGGDTENALQNFRDAVATAREGVEDGEPIFNPILVQTLIKLSRLYEQVGDVHHAFETTQESLRLVQSLVDSGEDQAKVMLTALYLQHGMLFERIGDSQSALAEFDRCRNTYLDVFRLNDTPFPGSYILRTGSANVSMCRGNMLADQKRFDEAAAAFEDAVWQYQCANDFRPENDTDETFIPYSIGVVQLNHANMLVAQGKLDEAVALKEQALAALRERMEAGHEEILPNLHAAYRKMIGIRRMQGEIDDMFLWIEKLISMLDAAVDEGKLEYCSDLASAYQLRCMSREEQSDFAAAEQDAIRAMRIFREIADDETESPEIHVAKIQWGEMLERTAILRTRQGRIDEAMALFKNATDDVLGLFNEGSKTVIFDVLLAYTQYVGFVEAVVRSSNFTDVTIKEGNLPEDVLTRLKNLSKIDPNAEKLPEGITQHSPEDFLGWLRNAMESCDAGIKLSQRQQLESKSPSTEQFFSMKVAFFLKMWGSLAVLAGEREKACEEFADAAKQWESLILGLEKLKAQNRYFAAEAGIPEINFPPGSSDDPYLERFLYFVGELRQTLQRWANVCIELKQFDEAERLFHREINLTRDLINKEIPNADRLLIISLMSCAKSSEEFFTSDKITVLYDEARRLIQHRLQSGDIVSEDYSMFRQIYVTYSMFLEKTGKLDVAKELMNDYIVFVAKISANKKFPEPEQWIELCSGLIVQLPWLTDPKEIEAARTNHNKLLTSHPSFEKDTQLHNIAEKLKMKQQPGA